MDTNFEELLEEVCWDIVLERLRLTHTVRGKNKNICVLLCPFHGDTKPSFWCRPNGRYVCYGCGAKGNIKKFIEEFAINHRIDLVPLKNPDQLEFDYSK